MSENLLDNMSYTNKSFQDIYPELLDLAKKISYRWDPTESNESDPGVVLLKLCAIIADKLNYNIDKNVLECFPVSVSQESNARELFEQLGYTMHWYIAASSNIQIAWKSADTGNVYHLPRFSMVSNDDSSIIYTITSDSNIPTDGSVVVCPVLQGLVQDFMINGDTLITTANLDSNNRIYFSNSNIAENGIFIKNNLWDYSDWRKVNNLEVEEFGQPVYKFGVSQDGNSCYLEFPEDAFDIFGDGLTIKYIVTDGEDGNISSRIIEKFYNNPTVYDSTDDSQSAILTTTNISVTNLDSIRNGSNPETISEAYSNYKRTVGTFDTLVSLRDYNNAIRSAKLNNINIVSNGFVTDRTNDIQSSYTIISDSDDINKVYTKIDDSQYNDSDSSYYKSMTAFDLKMYLLENILSSGNIIPSDTKVYKSAEIYNKTFDMVDNTDYSESYKVDLIKQSLEENKSLQHDFQHILSDKLCMLKNKYPIKCKIIPQYSLTSVQVEDVRSNVIKSLYNNLNSRKVEFGDEISYDLIYNIILNSDERIKSIMLDDIEYTTYAVYFDSNNYSFKEIEINNFSNFINGYYNKADDHFYYSYDEENNTYSNKINLIDDILYKDCVTSPANNVKNIYISNSEEDILLDDNSNVIIGSKIAVTFRYGPGESSNGLSLELYNSQTNELIVSQLPIKENSNGTFIDLSPSSALYWDSGSKRLLTYNGSFWVISFVEDFSNDYVFVDIPTGKCYKYTNGRSSDDIKSDIQLDIYSKSVLAGKTQLLVPDNVFDYRLNHKFVDQVLDINNVSTNANIRVYSTDSGNYQASTTLKDNESISFYAPNLVDKITYSSYTKVQYALAQEVNTGVDYKLSDGESITFYWKDSDDDNASYKYYKYGSGTIIHPNFSLRSAIGYYSLDESTSSYGTSKTHDEDDIEYVGFDLEYGQGLCSLSQSRYLSSIYSNDYILSSTKNVVIRDKVEVTITYPMYCYWILNDKTLNNSGEYVYKLFDAASLSNEDIAQGKEIEQKYILQPGEYFLYTNSSKDSLEILYSGTKITRKSKSKRLEALTCREVDVDSIPEVGLSDINDVLKQINYGEFFTLTEMQIKTVPANATIYMGAYDWQRDASLENSVGEQLSGTRIYGMKNSPMSGSQSIKASSGNTAYNLEYDNGFRWHTDTDDQGEEVYLQAPDGFADNIDISSIINVDPTGKDPNMVGVSPRLGYTNVNTMEAPDFYSDVFYEKIGNSSSIYDDSSYRELLEEPADWGTNFSNYYWKRPIHAYNPKYASTVIWENDDNLPVNSATSYTTVWKEDENYLALGYQISEKDVFPDLEKLNGTPTDTINPDGSPNYVWSYSSVYNWGAYYNLSDKDQDTINSYKRILYNYKYYRVGPENGPFTWYWNKQYKESLGNRLPKNTYHVYNPKFRKNGYVWESFDLESGTDTTNFIKITGENCKPSKCILVNNLGSWAYNLKIDGHINKVWSVSEGIDPDFVELSSQPSNSTDSNTLTIEYPINYYNYYNFKSYYENGYLYLKAPSKEDLSVYKWYQYRQVTSKKWREVNDWQSLASEQTILNSTYYIELDPNNDPTLNDYVRIVPKKNQFVANIQTGESSIEVYPVEYFKVVENYIPKSWTQVIEFNKSSNVQVIDDVDYYTNPTLENMSPSLDSHATHQYESYAWLEDQYYAFDDMSSSGSFGNASSINVVGATPNDEDYRIVATKDGKAYNPNFSYNYIWQEDSSYVEWDNPIVTLTGESDTPESASISVYSLDQHVINPSYVYGYTWTPLSSKPSDSNGSNTYYFSNSDLSSPPDVPAVAKNDINYYKYGCNTDSSSTWWMNIPTVGKSWTSVRVPVGKSWTSRPVIVSDSWTSVKEYTGKSWHSSLDKLRRAWRSVSAPVDVSFTNNGAIVRYPENYTLNDFYISSKLEDSSEIEDWPKVLVDDGWEAYSYLNLKVSKDTPFTMYENQEIIWYNKNYSESNSESNMGTISGRYSWKKENLDYDTSNFNTINVLVNSTSTEYNLMCESITPKQDLHLYDSNTKKSWTSTPEYVLENVDYSGHEDEYDLNNCILVDSFSSVKPKQSGIYYYTVSNGTVTLKRSAQSGLFYFIEDNVYSDKGYRIYDVVITESNNYITNMKASIYPDQSLALVTSSNKYVSEYVPIILISDYGYDLHGGNMLDVSRLNPLGNSYYMNLYCYENVNYDDNDIKVIDNFIYIDLNYKQFELKNESDVYVQDEYYTRFGSGTTADPYRFVIVSDTSQPADWSSSNIYYKATNKLDQDLSTTKVLRFNFPTGRYLLDIMNSVPNLDVLQISVIPVKDGEQMSINGVVIKQILNQIANAKLVNFYKSRKYYIDLNLTELKENSPYFNSCDSFDLEVYIKFKEVVGQEYWYSTSGNIRFDLVYRYNKPDIISKELYNSIINKMYLLDSDSIYNFTNIVDENINIPNPLDSRSFLNKNHIYNSFVICQIDTSDSSVSVVNK